MKKKLKKYLNDGIMLTSTGVGLGVMSGLDTSGATSKLSKAMPAIGGLYGASMVLDSVKHLNKKCKKKLY